MPSLPKSPLLLLLSCFTLLSVGAQAQKRKMPPKPSASEVYDSVAQPAVPLGGTERYAQFLADHQRYPATAMQKGIQGTVKVSFIVEKTGTVNEVKVETPLSPELDAEAIRLIKSAPKWTPAKHLRSQVVRQRIVVPVSFVMSPGSEAVVTTGAKERPITTSAADIAASANPYRPAVVAPDRPAQPVGGTQAFSIGLKKPEVPAAGPPAQDSGQGHDGVHGANRWQPDRCPRNKKLGSGLDDEALRLIKSAPKWEPATFQGKPIKQKMVLPVLFQL
ncbi:TonB family protein [Hymenobacter humi]